MKIFPTDLSDVDREKSEELQSYPPDEKVNVYSSVGLNDLDEEDIGTYT